MLLSICLQLRIFHSSDTHGWLFGNPHNQSQNAKFGDVLSFIAASKKNRTTLALDSGDYIQGSGLSDLSSPIGSYVFTAWKNSFKSNQFYDYITLGNHDQTINQSVKWISQNFFNDPNVLNHTIDYNTLLNDTPAGRKYKVAQLDGVKYLIIGIMYQITPIQPLTMIPYLNELKNDQLFSTMLKNVNTVLVLIHEGLNQNPQDYQAIYQLVRSQVDLPIILMGGHEHQVKYIYGIEQNENFTNPFPYLVKDNKDMNAIFMESENYYKSFSLIDFTIANGMMANVNYTLVVTNTTLMHLEYNYTDDPAAVDIQQYVDAKVIELNIKQEVGCAPHNYYFLEPNLTNQSCIWGLWLYSIVPQILYPFCAKNTNPVHIIGTSFFESDIYGGLIDMNDVCVTVPYADEYFYSYQPIKGSDLKSTFCGMLGGCKNDIRNTDKNSYNSGILKSPTGFPKYFMSIDVSLLDMSKYYTVIISNYDASKFESKAKAANVEVVRDDTNFSKMTPVQVYQNYVQQNWPLKEGGGCQ